MKTLNHRKPIQSNTMYRQIDNIKKTIVINFTSKVLYASCPVYSNDLFWWNKLITCFQKELSTIRYDIGIYKMYNFQTAYTPCWNTSLLRFIEYNKTNGLLVHATDISTLADVTWLIHPWQLNFSPKIVRSRFITLKTVNHLIEFLVNYIV